jgi:hypothetical protein
MYRHHEQMKRWTALTSAALLSLAVGCSKDPDFETFPAATPAPTVVATAAPATTVPETAPPATEPPAPTSTLAPTTTALPAMDQVVAAAELYFTQYSVCLSDPANCDPSAFSRGNALANLTSSISQMVGYGYFSGESDEPPILTIKSVDIAPNGALATVMTCVWDTMVIFGPPAFEGGEPLVVNNEKATARYEQKYVLEEGVWLISSGEQVGELVMDVNECDR